MNPKNIADNYEKEFGFMCLNALTLAGEIMIEVNADALRDELVPVRDVLLQRGWKLIHNQQEFDQACLMYGVPEAFKEGQQKGAL